jgi:hypothetical protein
MKDITRKFYKICKYFYDATNKKSKKHFGTKIPSKSPLPPFSKGGILEIPLFRKEGLGEIFILLCEAKAHVGFTSFCRGLIYQARFHLVR